MKKIFSIFVLVAAAAMALVSCNKQEVEAPKPQEVEYEYTFEIAGDTKATIGNDCVVWESGDQIGVYTDGQNGVSYNRYGNITLGSPVTFKISSYYALVTGDMVHCYYPYVSSNSEDPRTVNLSIPTSQTEKNQMPMVSLPYAVTENLAEKTDSEKSAGEIRFANLGSVIEFHVYSTTEAYQTELVKSVTFNADQAIAGDFTFDITAVDYSDEETLAISGYEATKVVSTLSTSTQVSDDRNAATVVKMVVAPGSYTGNIVVTTDKATYTYPISTAKEFGRSAVQPLGLNLRENVREENTSSEPVEVTATLTFDANKANRTEYSTSKQVWEQNDLQFINNKGTGNPIADYSNPVRLYKNSEIVITAPGKITEIIFNTSGADYVSALKSILTSVTASGNSVTAELDGSSNTVTYALTSGQVRLNSITVTYVVGGTTEPDQPENPEPEIVTLSSIKVSEDAKTEYEVGDQFVEPIVIATYSDGSTKEVDAEFTGYDMSVAATYTVTVSYTDADETKTTTYEIVVSEKEVTEVVAHKVTWDLSKDETSEATSSKIAWSSDGVNMVNLQGTARSGANNYYPGVDNRTSTRFYKGNQLTITPNEGYAINSVVFTATTTGYATELQGSTWKNASATVSETTITINPEDGREEILAAITGTCGFTKVVVDLVPSEGYVKPVVVLSSITLSGQTTNYTVGDAFNFNGTVTAKYSNGSTKTVTPTSVSKPDMTTAGDKEVTVTYTEEGVTVTATYTISVAEKSTEPEEPAEPVTATLSFANKAQRTSFSTSKQVWSQNGITFTNDKSNSTNNVADYAAPVRLYANSKVTIAAPGNITKIVFDANSSSYATAMKNSIGTVSGATVSVSSDKVTVTFANATASSFVVAKLTAQVRLDSITVTYEN